MSFSGESTLEIPQRMKECLLFIIFYARHCLCSCVSDYVNWTVSSRLSFLAFAVFPYRALLELVPQKLPVLNCYLVLSSCLQHSSLIVVEVRLAVTASEDFLFRDPHQSLKQWVRCTIMWAGVWEENKIANGNAWKLDHMSERRCCTGSVRNRSSRYYSFMSLNIVCLMSMSSDSCHGSQAGRRVFPYGAWRLIRRWGPRVFAGAASGIGEGYGQAWSARHSRSTQREAGRRGLWRNTQRNPRCAFGCHAPGPQFLGVRPWVRSRFQSSKSSPQHPLVSTSHSTFSQIFSTCIVNCTVTSSSASFCEDNIISASFLIELKLVIAYLLPVLTFSVVIFMWMIISICQILWIVVHFWHLCIFHGLDWRFSSIWKLNACCWACSVFLPFFLKQNTLYVGPSVLAVRHWCSEWCCSKEACRFRGLFLSNYVWVRTEE